MTDAIQTVREALSEVPLGAGSVPQVGEALAALDRVEAVVKAARDVDAEAWDGSGLPPVAFAELARRLAALDPTEAPASGLGSVPPGLRGDHTMTPRPRIALRPDDRKDPHNAALVALDDVVVEGCTLFRAEFMDDSSLWMRCYFGDDDSIDFHVSTKRAPIRMVATDLPRDFEDFDAGTTP